MTHLFLLGLDLFSHVDRFGGGGWLSYPFFWGVSLYFFVWVLSGSSYWMALNWVEVLVLRLHKFDPGQMHKMQAFSDPAFSAMVCSCWLIVGGTGLFSLYPYFNDLGRDPSFIYSVTMLLWWNALCCLVIGSPKNFFYSIFLTTKAPVYFIGILLLEGVSWVSRGLTFGGRFLASGSFGTFVSYALCDMLSSEEEHFWVVICLAFISFFWNVYETLAMGFQCYLVGLLGICFCSPRASSFSGVGNKKSFKAVLDFLRFNKRSVVAEQWMRFIH